MANEVLYTDLVTNGGAVAEVLSSMVIEQLYDPTDLTSLCSKVPYGDGGSLAQTVTLDAVPGAFAEVAEAASVANTAFTTDEFVLTNSQYMRAYELTDLVGISGSPIDLQRLVNNLMTGFSLTMTDLICNAFTSFTNTAGTSGVNLSIDDVFEAQFKNNIALNAGPMALVLAPVQVNDFRNALRSESGVMSFQAASAEALVAKGPGYQGSWAGMDVWQSDSCGTSGGNRYGALLGQGSIAYSLAPVAKMQGHIPAANVLLNAGELLVELVRDGYGGQTAAVAHMYPAASVIQASRGCQIITDA